MERRKLSFSIVNLEMENLKQNIQIYLILIFVE